MLSTSVTCGALVGRALYVETLDRAIARAAGWRMVEGRCFVPAVA